MSEPRVDLQSIVCWSETPVSIEINREVVLMNVSRDRCYGLGDTGSEIWRRLEKPIRLSDLCLQLEEMYDAPREMIELDVLKMIESLVKDDLVSCL